MAVDLQYDAEIVRDGDRFGIKLFLTGFPTLDEAKEIAAALHGGMKHLAERKGATLSVAPPKSNLILPS